MLARDEVLVSESGTLLLRSRRPTDRVLEFKSASHAQGWLREARSAISLRTSRVALARLTPTLDVARLELDEVQAALARALASGQLRAVFALAPTVGLTRPESQEPARATATARTWIEIVVFWDHADRPVAGVEIELTPSDGKARALHTDGSGKVRLDGIPPGHCGVRSDISAARRADTLHVVGVSDHSIGDAGEAPRRTPLPSKVHLARIDRHRVRTGETLASIAKGAGMTWQRLAEFNWGTSSPKKINERIHAEVGSTKLTQDGANYVFDDGDHPGILFVPSPWSSSFTTGDTHVLRVLQHRFVYVLYDEHRRFALPHHEYLLYDGDRHVETGESDELGRVMLESVPAHWHIDVIGPGPSHGLWRRREADVGEPYSDAECPPLPPPEDA